jgi:uncharacterized SAM-binding protein YcdF (DUF218 family)
VTPLPNLLVYAKERQHPVYRPRPADSLATHVLVLGGGHTIAPDLPANDQLSARALARLVEGVRIHRQLPNSYLVCSGFSSTQRTPQAVVQAQTALLLGVPAADTLLLTDPKNTEAEARAYANRFGREKQLILVTSAVHMPRALYWFRYYGLAPIPAPTDHWVKVDPQRSPFSFGPDSEKIPMLDSWIHESAGMLWATTKTLLHD